jgi:serine protease Do
MSQSARHRSACAAACLRTVLLGLALLASSCAVAPNGASARSAPESFSPLVKKVLPAVVNIAVTETVGSNELAGALPPALRGTPFERDFRNRLGKHQELHRRPVRHHRDE